MARADLACEPAEPADTVTERLNTRLREGGAGYTLSLCPEERYFVREPIVFASPQQEISTAGYPTDEARAMLVVSGPADADGGHTIAVDGSCAECDGVRIRNIQIDGGRGAAGLSKGGGNIQLGGDNADQLVEYTRSFSPRGWTCLHVAEGPFACRNVTIQYNDIGPCGSDDFQQWADGVSLSCRDSLVKENYIYDATDGGIVVFGSPGSVIEGNTIWVNNSMLLGGINVVDYSPWQGDFKGTIVRDNDIRGGFAQDEKEKGDTAGENFERAIIKIGIAIGPRTWFGDRYGDSRVDGGTVTGNTFSGAFSYAMAITSANNFTVLDNSMYGPTAFLGARGPNCSDADHVPTPQAWIVDWATVGTDMNAESGRVQPEFVGISDGDALTCVLPPNGGDFWPFGSDAGPQTPLDGTGIADADRGGGGSNKASVAGAAVGAIVGFAVLCVAVFYGRRWYLRKAEEKQCYDASRRGLEMNAYTQRLP